MISQIIGFGIYVLLNQNPDSDNPKVCPGEFSYRYERKKIIGDPVDLSIDCFDHPDGIDSCMSQILDESNRIGGECGYDTTDIDKFYSASINLKSNYDNLSCGQLERRLFIANQIVSMGNYMIASGQEIFIPINFDVENQNMKNIIGSMQKKDCYKETLDFLTTAIDYSQILQEKEPESSFF